MLVEAGTHEGIYNKLVDENGEEIQYVKSWDTESHIAEVYVMEQGQRMKLGIDGLPEIVKVHLPKAKLVPVRS